MKENTIENIYSDFRSTFVDKPEFIIDFYNKNAIFFNNIKSFKDKEELKLFIEMTCKYVEALYLKDRYNMVVDTIDKQQVFIDQEILRLNATDIKDAWYYSISFVKGMASYKLKDFKAATQIFKELVSYDNQNDRYKNWLRYSLSGQRRWLVNAIYVVSMILIFTEMFFKSSITNNSIRQTLLGIGLLGIIGNSIYEYYIKRSFRKTQNRQ
jgi:hypothetical protein